MDIKEMCKCECGGTGHIFVCSGTPFWGHFCKFAKSFVTRNLPAPDWLELYKQFIGVGRP